MDRERLGGHGGKDNGVAQTAFLISFGTHGSLLGGLGAVRHDFLLK